MLQTCWELEEGARPQGSSEHLPCGLFIREMFKFIGTGSCFFCQAAIASLQHPQGGYPAVRAI